MGHVYDEGLAERAADLLFMSVDPRSAVNPVCWRTHEPHVRRAVAILEQSPDIARVLPDIERRLAEVPTDWAAHSQALELIGAALRRSQRLHDELRAHVDDFYTRALMLPYRGSRFGVPPAKADVRPEVSRGLRAAAGGGRRPPGAHAVTVVVDIRVRSDAARLSNVLCVLSALQDQTLPRDRYRVVVVEQDAEPFHQPLLQSLADEYVFAENEGPYNRSWAHNVGAAHGPGDGEFLLFLDADFIIPRDFLSSVLNNGSTTDTAAVAPFQDIIYLDPVSTARAVEQRFELPEREVDGETLFGYRIRGVPGAAALLVRRAVFFELGGYDERLEGWGKEDCEFYERLSQHHRVSVLSDAAFHLHHQITASAVSADSNHEIVQAQPHAARSADMGKLDLYARREL